MLGCWATWRVSCERREQVLKREGKVIMEILIQVVASAGRTHEEYYQETSIILD